MKSLNLKRDKMKIYELASDFLSYFMSLMSQWMEPNWTGEGKLLFSEMFFRFVMNESIIACWHWPALSNQCSCFMIESFSQTLGFSKVLGSFQQISKFFTTQTETFKWPLYDTHAKSEFLNWYRSLRASFWLDGHPCLKGAIMKQTSWKFHWKYFVELWN